MIKFVGIHAQFEAKRVGLDPESSGPLSIADLRQSARKASLMTCFVKVFFRHDLPDLPCQVGLNRECCTHQDITISTYFDVKTSRLARPRRIRHSRIPVLILFRTFACPVTAFATIPADDVPIPVLALGPRRPLVLADIGSHCTRDALQPLDRVLQPRFICSLWLSFDEQVFLASRQL